MGEGGAATDGDEARAVERHVRVARTARYWMLGEPGPEVEEVWVLLHGYGQLARRFLRRFTRLTSPSRLLIAPEALSRFYIGSGEGRHGPDALVGATWMTREDRETEIDDYVAYLDALAAAVVTEGQSVTVLGFSQGAATAWRWVTYGSVPWLARLVAWAGSLPPDLDLGRARRAVAGAEVVLVSGERDRTVPPVVAEESMSQLRAVGIATRLVRHDGGHDIDEGALLNIAG